MRKPLPFGKYLLLDRVAVGGMAEVFAAKSFGVEGFERLIAIKRILPTMVEDDEFVAMFLDEARITARLNHATIAQIYELGKHDETYFIAMEYVSGRDVRLIIDKFRKRNESVPLSLASYITARIAEGLDYAHNKTDEHGEPLGIIHRDISPQNVLVSYDGEVKLIDFGIAKAAGRNQKTQVGILKGKFAYMSPEQVRGNDIDHRSDLFSVGVMLYEMITGVKLFSGESDFSTLEKVRAGDVRSPSELNPSIPDELERIVLKALAKERDDRYQSGAELCDDLMRFLYQEGSEFGSKSLARFMSETFVDELRKENERQRRWWVTATEEVSDDILETESPKPPQKVRIGSAADAPPLEDEVDEAAARKTATPPRPVDDQETRVGPASIEGEETRVGPSNVENQETRVSPAPAVEDQATRVGPAPAVEDQATRVGPAPASEGDDRATLRIEPEQSDDRSTVILRNPTLPPGKSPPPKPPPSSPPPVRQVVIPPQVPPPDRRSRGGGFMGIAAGLIVIAAAGLLAVQLLKPGGIREVFSPGSKGVTIDVTPAEATVELDGQPLAGQSHFLVRPVPGPHRLRVSAPHFETMEREFSVPTDAPIALHLAPEPQPAEPVVAVANVPDAGAPTTEPAAPPGNETPPPAPAHPPATAEGHPAPTRVPAVSPDRKALEKLAAGSSEPPAPPPAPPTHAETPTPVPPPVPPPAPPHVATTEDSAPAQEGESAAVPTTASLSLETDPPGAIAKVMIPGQAPKMVKTPGLLEKVPTARPLPIVFVLQGYERKEITASLEAGHVVAVKEKLTPKPSNKESMVVDTGGAENEQPAKPVKTTGTLSVLCFPVANIVVDGKNSGQRTSVHSVLLPLPTGHHTVSCATESGKASAPLEFDLVAGQTQQYRARVQ